MVEDSPKILASKDKATDTFLSDATHCLMVTSKSVCCTTVSGSGSESVGVHTAQGIPHCLAQKDQHRAALHVWKSGCDLVMLTVKSLDVFFGKRPPTISVTLRPPRKEKKKNTSSFWFAHSTCLVSSSNSVFQGQPTRLVRILVTPLKY